MNKQYLGVGGRLSSWKVKSASQIQISVNVTNKRIHPICFLQPRVKTESQTGPRSIGKATTRDVKLNSRQKGNGLYQAIFFLEKQKTVIYRER